MLVTEDKMTEGDGLLLMQPTAGLGYQLAGAFLRLGRRTVARLREASESQALSQLNLPTLSWDGQGAFPGKANEYAAVFVTPHPELGFNRPLSNETLTQIKQQMQSLRELNPDLHVIAVLPKTGPAAHAEALLREATRTTVLLTPALYGFRDGGLMDEALMRLQSRPGTLLKPAPGEPIELVYSGDLAALLVSAIGKETLFGKVLEVPATTRSLEEWREAFVATFASEITTEMNWLEKLATRISNERPFEDFAQQVSATAPQVKGPEALPLLDYFPTVLTPLKRALSTVAGHHRRNPQLELSFPPSRGL